MQFLRNNRLPPPQPISPRETPPDYGRLITDNLAYMEKQCRRAVARYSADMISGEEMQPLPNRGNAIIDNEADELLNGVLDHLRADDFRALREFRGNAKLTTYITTIISNLIVDLVRQKKGRSRARERARKMGGTAELLHELMYLRGCSLHEAQSHLEITHGIREPLEKLQGMMDQIRGRGRQQAVFCADGESAWLVPGWRITTDDTVEIEVPDPRKNAEAAIMSGQKRSEAKRAVAGLIAELDGEERFMLGMRFPANEEEEPKSNREISRLLGLSEKSVDARIRRILVRFREILLREGLSLDDLIDP
jgi:RNA polymerase sigma factor (sigma-70 family)